MAFSFRLVDRLNCNFRNCMLQLILNPDTVANWEFQKRYRHMCHKSHACRRKTMWTDREVGRGTGCGTGGVGGGGSLQQLLTPKTPQCTSFMLIWTSLLKWFHARTSKLPKSKPTTVCILHTLASFTSSSSMAVWRTCDSVVLCVCVPPPSSVHRSASFFNRTDAENK